MKKFLVLAIALTTLAGCGSDSGSTTTDSSSKGLGIDLAEYSMSPADATASAGKVTVDANNTGAAEHELVLVKADAVKDLPTTGSAGAVDEEGLSKAGIETIGEISGVAPGESKSGSFDLEPGKYVMFCNIANHFELGMSGTLTVR